MEVYVESVIIDNFVIDGLIGILTLKTLRFKTNHLRIALSAAVGTAFALVMPFVRLNAVILLLIKTAAAFLLVLLLAPYKKFPRFLLAYLTYFGYTFLLGGACIGIIYLMTGDINSALSLNYQSPVCIGLILFLGAAAVFGVSRAAVYINRKRAVLSFYRVFSAEINGKSTGKLNGFVDSGNSLYADNLPVVVIKASAIKAVFTPETLERYLLTGSLKEFPCGRLMEFSTLSDSKQKIPVFRPDKLVIYSGGRENIIYDVMIGITFSDFSRHDADALLHPAIA